MSTSFRTGGVLLAVPAPKLCACDVHSACIRGDADAGVEPCGGPARESVCAQGACKGDSSADDCGRRRVAVIIFNRLVQTVNELPGLEDNIRAKIKPYNQTTRFNQIRRPTGVGNSRPLFPGCAARFQRLTRPGAA